MYQQTAFTTLRTAAAAKYWDRGRRRGLAVLKSVLFDQRYLGISWKRQESDGAATARL